MGAAMHRRHKGQTAVMPEYEHGVEQVTVKDGDVADDSDSGTQPAEGPEVAEQLDEGVTTTGDAEPKPRRAARKTTKAAE